MKKQNEETLLKYNLQFFAEGGEDSDNNNDDANNDNNGGNDDQTSKGSGAKTFTQEEVSAMMAKEKNEGKRSVLKSLGYKSEEDLKKVLDGYNKYLESKKTDEEKSKEELAKANEAKNEAIDRATIAESKIACFEAGVNKDYVDDVMAIALTKTTDDKSLADVIKEMKDDKKYSSFFGTVDAKGGTGGNPGHSSGSGKKEESIGKRLASQHIVSKEQKSSFFDN